MQIRRKSFLALGGLAAGTTLLAACGGSDSDTDSGSGGGGASDGGGGSSAGQLVIWADEEKAPALEPSAKAWGEENGIEVVVEVVPGDELQANFITANQAGNGPDVTMGAHDWIGNLVQNGAISPVQLPSDVADTIAPVGIDAVTYDGQTYGVPYAVETLALFANNELTDVAEPGSLEELISAAEDGGAENILSLPIGESGDPYHMQPIYTSAGGYLFGKDSEGNLDPSDLGVGEEGSLVAADKISELGEQGAEELDHRRQLDLLFAEGKAATCSRARGPWPTCATRASTSPSPRSPASRAWSRPHRSLA